jgi:hypothetical protein
MRVGYELLKKLLNWQPGTNPGEIKKNQRKDWCRLLALLG